MPTEAAVFGGGCADSRIMLEHPYTHQALFHTL